MIESLALMAALAMGPSDSSPEPSRDVSPSRSSANRFMDSGDARAWRGVPAWIRQVGLCIRLHESINAGHYRAENGSSSAAGAYQFIQSTWTGNARHTKGAKRYAHLPASSAPPWVQDRVFIHSVQRGGLPNWFGTGCPGTG